MNDSQSNKQQADLYYEKVNHLQRKMLRTYAHDFLFLVGHSIQFNSRGQSVSSTDKLYVNRYIDCFACQ